jgi:hypothetical protein
VSADGPVKLMLLIWTGANETCRDRQPNADGAHSDNDTYAGTPRKPEPASQPKKAKPKPELRSSVDQRQQIASLPTLHRP